MGSCGSYLPFVDAIGGRTMTFSHKERAVVGPTFRLSAPWGVGP